MDVQEALDKLQVPNELSILTITRPIVNSCNERKRTSTGSASSEQANRTPSALQADLVHYQELFSKLRFSYVEQVTKERFLRAVTAEIPEFVNGAENVELEEKLKTDKAALKEKKEEVRGMIGDLEEQGMHLAEKYEGIQLQLTQLEPLPTEIANLKSTISALQASQQPKSSNPTLSMPLQPTLSILSQREQELADLNRQIAQLQAEIPEKKRVNTSIEAELGALESRKNGAVQSAREAKKGRKNGGLGDELEERGRWLKGVDHSLRAMLDV